MERIAVFCSASQDIDDTYAEKARELGAWMGDNGKCLVYGGTSSGLMEEIAAEAKAHGAMVMGVVPTIVEERGKTSELCDVVFRTDNLSDRKDTMLREAEVAIALPGGVGTMDEIFHVMASATIGYHNKQVIFYNINGFWDGVIAFLNGLEKQHFAHSPLKNYYLTVSAITLTLSFISLALSFKGYSEDEGPLSPPPKTILRK